MDLILENIRCFAGRHQIPIKPLTFLIGENSTGKTTFLAALSAVYDFGFPLRPRFNAAPYSLGNYDTIATYKVGRHGSSKSFSLGYASGVERGDSATPWSAEVPEIVATYTEHEGTIVLDKLAGRDTDLEVSVSFPGVDEPNRYSVHGTYKQQAFEFDGPAPGRIGDLSDIIALTYPRKSDDRTIGAEAYTRLIIFLNSIRHRRAMSIAPIRSKPRRTYDQITEEFTPEGDHVPFALARILANDSSKASLDLFGRESGLFKQIEVRKLGDKISDPIQVMVTHTNQSANLLDVGYGVSQALPVVVESTRSESNDILLQQPEVHLHPRAQAALGSFLVDMNRIGKNFVVETHSDYILDRVRLEVARVKISPEQVGILYFEKHHNETKVYPISLDEKGNVLDAPATYREFFLRELDDLLDR
jgi:hypothetical protein